ncbi:hypothetical protein QCA50_015245 [Cerrena zonata]|uniref:Ras GEF n=1 Tax=Cerrena zonata TaxID=2478898 RepID=A0AAW0FVC4_9APHY
MIPQPSRQVKVGVVTPNRHRRPSTAQSPNHINHSNSSLGEPSRSLPHMSSWSSGSTDWPSPSAPHNDHYMSRPIIRLHIGEVTSEIPKERTPSPLSLPSISPLRILRKATPPLLDDESLTNTIKPQGSKSSLSFKLNPSHSGEESPKSRVKRLRTEGILDQPLGVAIKKRLRSNSLASSSHYPASLVGPSKGRSSPSSPLSRSPSQSPKLSPTSPSSTPGQFVSNVLRRLPSRLQPSVPSFEDPEIGLREILETYSMAQLALESKDVAKAQGYFKGFRFGIEQREKEVEAGAKVILETLEYQQAKRDLHFHRDVLLHAVDTLGDTSQLNDTDPFERASDILEMLWGSFKHYLLAVESALNAYREEMFAQFGYTSRKTDEIIATQLQKVATCHEQANNFQVMKAKLFAYLHLLAGTNSPGSKLIKKRPLTRDRSRSLSSNNSNPSSEITSEILTGAAIGRTKISLRDSLLIMSGSSTASWAASWAVKIDRPKADTEVKLNVEDVVVSATLAQYVRLLTDTVEVCADDYASQLDTFFLNFRQFTTPKTLFKTLVARYNELPPSGLNKAQLSAWNRYHRHAKLLTVKMILWWTEWYWVAPEDESILRRIIKFTHKRLATDPHFHSGLAELVATNICRNSSPSNNPHASACYSKRFQRTLMRYAQPPPPDSVAETGFEQRIQEFRQFVKTGGLGWDHINIGMFGGAGGAREIARALTIMENDIFHKMLPEDVARFYEGGDHPPALEEWTKFTNSLSLWPVHEVLKHSDPQAQAKTFMIFVEIAAHCRRLRNFSSTLGLVTGLKLNPFNPLKRMHGMVDKQHHKILQELHEFLGNAKSYHAELRQRGPAIPTVYRIRRAATTYWSQSKLNIKPKVVSSSERAGGTPCAESANPDPSGTSEGASVVVDRSSEEVKEEDMIPVLYYQKMRNVVSEVERYYGDFHLTKVDVIHQWIDFHRKPVDVEINEFEKKKDELYKRSCEREPPEQLVGSCNRVEHRYKPTGRPPTR